MKRLSILLPVLAALLMAHTGCQSANMGFVGKDLTNLFNKKKVEEVKPEPVRMAVIWKDGVYEAPGKPTTRGLGGRIYFYNSKNEPIEAEGELIVYGFDDTKTKEAQKPRKFVFPEEEFQQYASKTDLGESYSVWVPWDKAGGIRKAVSLIPIFKTSSGKLLKSGQTLCVLPGKAPDPTEITSEDDRDPHVKTFHNNLYKVSQSGHRNLDNSYIKQASGVDDDELFNKIGSQSATVSYQQRTRKIETSTIRIPKTLSEKMKTLPPQQFQNANRESADSKDGTSERMKEYLEKLRSKTAAAETADAEKTAADGKTEFGKIGTGGIPGTIGKFPTRRPVFGMPGNLN